MAENYSRPASGFNFKFGGINTRTPADKMQENKYPVAQNIRAYDGTSIRNRPGLSRMTNATGNAATSLRAYSTLGTDNLPRYLYKSGSNVYLDNGSQVDSGYEPNTGASMIPYRPNQSPQSWMYAADNNLYRKLSAPDSSNAVNAQNVGIAEPQLPVEAGISDINFSYVGLPDNGQAIGFVPTGAAGPVTGGSRVDDTVLGVFQDPTLLGMKSLQVSDTASIITPGVYKSGPVNAYFWSAGTSGVFQPLYPYDPSTAVATASGNSFNFNYPGFSNLPSYMPMQWAVISNGAVSSFTQPWSGATTNYNMVVMGNLYVPVAGNYVINVNHDDGMFFAIDGATLVSGPVDDPVHHVKTAVGGYAFASGSPIAGTNQEGAYTETFVINFPAPGIYPVEFDYNQMHVFQQMNVLYNNGLILDPAAEGTGYQRYMAIQTEKPTSEVHSLTVQDVFSPLPSQIGIESIGYYSGNTGRCVVVPASLSPIAGTDGQSLYEQSVLSGLRRGSLVKIGAETCYVLNVTNGPSGNVCFETVTTSTHTSADVLSGITAVAVFDPTNVVAVGDTISSNDYQFAVGTGVGSISSPVPNNPFVSNSFSFQSDDYVHISVNVDNLTNLSEMKLLFDVSDSTFTNNFYYYSIRPNDIVGGIDNKLTQLGVAQLVSQRATIDAVNAAETGNQGFTSSSSQSTTGNSQWSEIMFPISALTRVGNDQTKSLQNTVAVSVLFNCSGPVSAIVNSISVMGGFAPDVGDVGAPYQYVIRARSSVTGAKSNPSPVMRYGINPRRGEVTVIVPNSYADPQADQWDIFRLGGSVTDYTYIGSVTIGSTTKFIDTYSDGSIVSSEQIEYDNFEPWPTIDLPLNTTAASIIGTVATITITDGVTRARVLRYLPGNLVKAGQQVYRLWTRPTAITSNQIRFQFVENAGTTLTTSSISIYEPAMAKQLLPYLWGPTEEGGNLFGCGDPIRPGYVYFSKNFQPDSAPDSYNIELCPPSEPLLGGETLNGNSYVASTDRWWQMRPSFGGQNQYTPNEAPVGRGLAAPFGHCTDGSRIYFVAKDGIYATNGGTAVSLTDEDLYTLFPHEGISGVNFTYNGVTVYAPDYGRVETFRLAYDKNYIYFDYADSTGHPRTLVYDVRNSGWIKDNLLGDIGATVHYSVEQQAGTLGATDAAYTTLVLGGANGALYKELDSTMDDTSPIECYLSTHEFTAGDYRAPKLIGDIYLDFLSPTNATSPSLSVQFLSLGVPIPGLAAKALTQAATRQQIALDVNGGTATYSAGMFFHWTISGASMSAISFYTWQPSYIDKPEITGARAEDWDNAGYEGAKWIQGFILEANTSGAVKQIGVRNADDQQLKQTFPVKHPIQNEQAYSFTTPFVSHMLRIEPQDSVSWQFFNVKWVWEPTPETVTTWWSQGSDLGFDGYGHVYNLEIAYAAGSDVNFTMFFDGQQQNYVLPATAGQYTKYNLNLHPNKGKIYSFRFQSSSGNRDLQLWLQDMNFQVGAWDRTTEYANYAKLGGNRGDGAKV